jgi:hypothetical protein
MMGLRLHVHSKPWDDVNKFHMWMPRWHFKIRSALTLLRNWTQASQLWRLFAQIYRSQNLTRMIVEHVYFHCCSLQFGALM